MKAIKIIGVVCLLLAFFAVHAFAAWNVTLEWNQNTEEDLAGYKIYWKAGSGGGPPYDAPGSPAVINLDDVGFNPAAPEYVVANLPDGHYWFVATAFDVWGLESDYSNEVNEVLNEQPAPPQELNILRTILAWFFDRVLAWFDSLGITGVEKVPDSPA